MITDRISLHIAYIYLTQVEETMGKLSNIEFSKRTLTKNVTKGLKRFANLKEFKTYIKTQAPLIAFDKLDCQPVSLYELKAFNIITPQNNKNFVYSDNRTFKLTSRLNDTGLQILNRSYIPKFNKVLQQFQNLEFDEYIIQQYTYIDCGYIYTFFNEDYQQLRDLYKKYKNI